MASEHIARAYDEELHQLNNTIAEMGGLAEGQLGAAIEAVATRDTELAARVVEGDVQVDQLERLVGVAFLQEYREIFAVAAGLCLLAALVAGLTIGRAPAAVHATG